MKPAGFLARTLDEALAMARKVTEVTHNHPEGLKGSSATARAIFLARGGAMADQIRKAIQSEYGYDLSRTVDAIHAHYRFNESCHGTVPKRWCTLSKPPASRMPTGMRSQLAVTRIRLARQRAAWRRRCLAFPTS